VLPLVRRSASMVRRFHDVDAYSLLGNTVLIHKLIVGLLPSRGKAMTINIIVRKTLLLAENNCDGYIAKRFVNCR
jgi:hypothetical protein